MSYKKLIPFINGENELAANVVTMAEDYCLQEQMNCFYTITLKYRRKRRILATLKEIDKKIDIPLLLACMQPVLKM